MEATADPSRVHPMGWLHPIRRTIASAILVAAAAASATSIPLLAGQDRGADGDPIPDTVRSGPITSATSVGGPVSAARPSGIVGGPVAVAPAAPRPLPTTQTTPDLDTPASQRPQWQQLETSYDLSVTLDRQTSRATVTETIEVVDRSSSDVGALDLSILAASFGEFRLRRLTVDDVAVTPTWPNPADLRVTLPRPIAPGLGAKIGLDFDVLPSPDISSSQQLRTSSAEGITRFGGWFPIVSDGHDRRLPGDAQVTMAARRMTLDVTYDPRLTVAAPGIRTVDTPGHAVYEIAEARDLAFAVSSRYTLATRQVGDQLIEAYLVEPRGARAVLDDAEAAMRTFEAAYGRYPYRRFVIAASPRTRSGNEYPGIVFLGAESLTDRVVIAHEVAHQWFYGVLGNDQIEEPWVDEAFAEFSAEHFFGTLRPSCSGLPVDSPTTAFPDRRSGTGCDEYDDVVYRRGALMIDAVRREMGDDRFFATLRSLIAADGDRIVTGREVAAAWLDAAPDRDAMSTLLAGYLTPATLADARSVDGRTRVTAP